MSSETLATSVHPHQTDGSVVCRNCEHRYTGRYCNQCGQPADTHPINWHYIWHDIPHSLWHLDRGILFTLRQLLTRPGHSIREFLEGKRINHYRPLALLLILGALVVFAAHSLGINLAEQSQRVFNPSSADASSRLKLLQEQISYFVEKNRTLLHIAAIPLYAFWFWLLFRGRGYNYPEQLVVQTFVANVNLLATLVLMLLFWVLGSSATTISLVVGLTLLLMIGYNALVYVQLFKGKLSPRPVILRSMVAYVLGYVSFVLMGMLIGGLYVVLNKEQFKSGSHGSGTKVAVHQPHH